MLGIDAWSTIWSLIGNMALISTAGILLTEEVPNGMAGLSFGCFVLGRVVLAPLSSGPRKYKSIEANILKNKEKEEYYRTQYGIVTGQWTEELEKRNEPIRDKNREIEKRNKEISPVEVRYTKINGE